MNLPRPTHCKNGHPWNDKNTHWAKRPDGRPKRYCRRCASDRKRAKYRCDEAFREHEKARARVNLRRKSPEYMAIMAMVIPDRGQYRCS